MEAKKTPLGGQPAAIQSRNAKGHWRLEYIKCRMENPRAVALQLTKLDWILLNLIFRPLNTNEARPLGDSCLHTTVAEIQSRRGIRVERRLERQNGFAGKSTYFARYWLTPDECARAIDLIYDKLRRAGER